jgi:hypothetical protein
MPDYATQIPARDRWLITAYVRALQVSQNTTLSALPAAEAAAARTELDKPAPQPEPNAHQADEKSEKHK